MTSPSKEPANVQGSATSVPDTANLQPDETLPSFGWNRYAEQTNGRFAMIGFVALLLTELVTGQDFFTWIGLR